MCHFWLVLHRKKNQVHFAPSRSRKSLGTELALDSQFVLLSVLHRNLYLLQLVGTDHCTFNSTQKAFGIEDFRKIPNGVNGNKKKVIYLPSQNLCVLFCFLLMFY